MKSILKNGKQEEQFRQDLKQNYRQTLKELNPKINQVLEEQGYDTVLMDSLEDRK